MLADWGHFQIGNEAHRRVGFWAHFKFQIRKITLKRKRHPVFLSLYQETNIMSSGWLQNACNSPTPDDMRVAFAFNRVGCRGQYSAHTSGTSTSVIGIFDGDVLLGVQSQKSTVMPYCDEGYMECYAHHPEIFPSPTAVPACPSEFGFIPKEVECPTNACLYTARLDPCAVHE